MGEITTGELAKLLKVNGKPLTYRTLEKVIDYYELVVRVLPSGMRLFDGDKAQIIKSKLPKTLHRGQSLLDHLKP